MEPNKNIPRFCFESPSLSFEMSSVDPHHNIDAEAELITILTEQIHQEIDRNIVHQLQQYTIAQDLVPVQPLFDAPQGRLMYFDYQFDLNENFRNPIVYKDGSWSEGNTFEGVIGIKSEIKSHTFI